MITSIGDHPLSVFLRFVWTHLGYKLGTKAVGTITEGAERIGKALKQKKVSPVVLIVATFVVAIVCSFFGIL